MKLLTEDQKDAYKSIIDELRSDKAWSKNLDKRMAGYLKRLGFTAKEIKEDDGLYFSIFC